MGRLILAVDFHGVVCSYRSRYRGPGVSDDPPTPGAFEFLLAASREFDVAVCSAAFAPPGRAGQAAKANCLRWFRRHGFPEGLISLIPGWTPIHLTGSRPRAHLSLDDRAIRFEGTFPALDDVRGFRPWNRPATPAE